MTLKKLLLRSRYPDSLAKLILAEQKAEILEIFKYLYFLLTATVTSTTKATSTATTASKYCSNFPHDQVDVVNMPADQEQIMINLFCPTTKGVLLEFEFALILM